MLIGAISTTVSAHGHVTGVVADGTYFQGYSPSMQFQNPPPAVVGWSCPQCLDNGFVEPSMFSTSNIACHKGATAAQKSATVSAGGKVEIQWTEWPESHKGPVIDYLAKCDGDCSTATAEGLRFFKINEGGLINGAQAPGTWASDQLIASNNSWTVPIPSTLAAGNYVLRHEIIALHDAGQENGAQNYPQCINIQVTGGGSASPAGVPATQLYRATDPGILISIYQSLASYIVPGPAIFSSGSGNAVPAPAPTSSSVVAITSAPATTSVAATITSAPATEPTSIEVIEVVTTTTAVTSFIDASDLPVPTEIAPAISQIDEIVSAIPTSILTGTVPTATGVPGVPGPSKPISEGVTLGDLLEWITYILRTESRRGGKRGSSRHIGRSHPRAF